MHADLDVLVDGDNRYVGQPSCVAHEEHECPLELVAAV